MSLAHQQRRMLVLDADRGLVVCVDRAIPAGILQFQPEGRCDRGITIVFAAGSYMHIEVPAQRTDVIR
jgi:hypothetical protein